MKLLDCNKSIICLGGVYIYIFILKCHAGGWVNILGGQHFPTKKGCNRFFLNGGHIFLDEKMGIILFSVMKKGGHGKNR